MTPRERVLIALKRKGKPDRVPFEMSWGAFTPGLMKIYQKNMKTDLPPEECFDFDTRSVNLNPTNLKSDFSQYFNSQIPANTIFDEWGAGRFIGNYEHFTHLKFHPLASATTVQAIEDYHWPDVTADYRFEGLGEKVAHYQQRGYAVTGELAVTIFETAWALRGMENLLLDFLIKPEIAHAICEQITHLRMIQARKYAQIGVDILRLGDDVASQQGPLFSIEIYRRFIKERTCKIIQAAKKINPEILIFMHSDGKVEDFIDEYLDIGVDIVNPVQPECNDLEKIEAQYHDKISFWGGIGTQTTMPFGTPAEVKQEVTRIKNLLGKNGGLLLAPTHLLEPEVPWENVIAFIEAAKNSWYDSPAKNI